MMTKNKRLGNYRFLKIIFSCHFLVILYPCPFPMPFGGITFRGPSNFKRDVIETWHQIKSNIKTTKSFKKKSQGKLPASFQLQAKKTAFFSAFFPKNQQCSHHFVPVFFFLPLSPFIFVQIINFVQCNTQLASSDLPASPCAQTQFRVFWRGVSACFSQPMIDFESPPLGWGVAGATNSPESHRCPVCAQPPLGWLTGFFFWNDWMLFASGPPPFPDGVSWPKVAYTVQMAPKIYLRKWSDSIGSGLGPSGQVTDPPGGVGGWKRLTDFHWVFESGKIPSVR